MRLDGRTLDELRPIEFALDYVTYPEGSVLIHMGGTRILCNATLDERLPGWRRASGLGWLTAEYALLPRSTHERTPRETKGLRGRTQEIRRLIARALRTCVVLEALGPRQFVVDCDVLQADGGTRTAAITGGYVAVTLALKRLIRQGMLSPDVIGPPVAAVSVGLVNGQPHLDLCYAEDARAEVDLNVVMTAEGNYVEVQGTAEGQPFDRPTLDALLDLATLGIKQISDLQQQALQDEQN